MKKILHPRPLYITITLIVIAFVISMMLGVGNSNKTELVTTVVEDGPVRQLVSVSGIADAKRSAQLAFPTSGIVREVRVETGSEVAAGDILVTLDRQSLAADRQEAVAALAQAKANLAELQAGPTVTTRAVSEEAVLTKEIALKTTRETEQQKIDNAYRLLLSSDLTAYTDDLSEQVDPPVISGTYRCAEEGTYTLSVYSSQADSGYSFNLSGLETGTYTAAIKQPGPLGACGLQITFTEGDRYTNSTWQVDIPNKRSSSYTTNYNNYLLTMSQAENAIALAEQALALATAETTNQNAPARAEAVIRAEAAVTQATARLARVDTAIRESTLTAPFAGTVITVAVLPGETVSTAPVVTLLASDEFDVKARIPEIDISKLVTGQAVEMLFDARTTEIITGVVTFISPEATVIDGVAYYEATITFDDMPAWMRSGLNADIDIIINQTTEELRIPKRFLIKTDTGYEVLQKRGEIIATTTVDLVLEGNDGFVAITGLKSGDTLVAP